MPEPSRGPSLPWDQLRSPQSSFPTRELTVPALQRGAWGDDAEEHTCFQVGQVQGTVEAAAEDALAAGRPPGGPHRLAVQGVGLQAAPRVHSIPHLRGKHSARHQKWGGWSPGLGSAPMHGEKGLAVEMDPLYFTIETRPRC